MTEPASRRLWEALVGHRRDDGAIALRFDADKEQSSAWTGRALADATTAIGDRLAGAGIGPGQLVGILCGGQETQAVHFLAALAAGAIPTILTPPTSRQEPHHARRTLEGVITAVRPHAVVTDLPEGVLPEAAGPDVLRAGDARLLRERRHPVPGRHSAPDVAFAQFSSGTTGLKKGVAVSYEAVISQIQTYAFALSIREERDSVVSWLPLYHDMGFMTALQLPLATRIPAAMIEPVGWAARPVSYLQVASRLGATLGWHPNFALHLMAARVRDADLEGVDLSRLRMVANCSEPATWIAQRRFADRFARHGFDEDAFSGCYAMAETTFAVTHGDRSMSAGIDPDPPGGSGHDRRPMISVGRALPGVEMAVRGPGGEELGDREVGEIWVRSDFLATAYLENPDATAASFRDGWYRTGDLGYRSGGSWYVSGRCKDLLIVDGLNIFPGDVEAIVGDMAGFRAGRVAAFAEFDDAVQSERVVVLAEPEEHGPVDLLGARQRLSAELGLTRVVVHVVPPGWLVKSSSGKMARAACAQKWELDPPVVQYARAAPG